MQKLVADVLTAWRSAERLLGDMAADDPAHAAVLAASEQLQATFNDLTLASAARQESAAGGHSEAEAAVHEISKDLAADARRLHAIETKKSRPGVGDERLVDLSEEAKDLGAQIAEKAAIELKVAEEAVG